MHLITSAVVASAITPVGRVLLLLTNVMPKAILSTTTTTNHHTINTMNIRELIDKIDDKQLRERLHEALEHERAESLEELEEEVSRAKALAEHDKDIRSAEDNLHKATAMASTDSHGDYDEIADAAARDLVDARDAKMKYEDPDRFAEQRFFYGCG